MLDGKVYLIHTDEGDCSEDVGGLAMVIPADTIKLLIEESAEQADKYDMCNVQLMAVAELPTRFGDFQIVGFESPCDGKFCS